MSKYKSDFMSFFDTEYLPKLEGRAPTFRSVMREACSEGVANIIETGSIRLENNWSGDGQSTIIFDAYMRWANGNFDTVDIDDQCMNLTKNLQQTTFYCMDSVRYLLKREDPIDLLYLDSFDIDIKEPHKAAMHCMFEFCAAQTNLHSGSIIFIDDSPMTEGFIVEGKGKYVAEYFKHLGISPFVFGYQAAWRMP